MTEPAAEPSTPGALLRAAREKQGLHIAALAAAIKVSPRKLDALENDRWHELPDANFTRALAQTVCRTLKIDARPVLDKLPAAAPVVLEPPESGLNAPFRDRPGREEPGLAMGAVRPMVWGAALLMAAALVVYFTPAGLFNQFVAPAATASVPTPAVPPAQSSTSPALSAPQQQPAIEVPSQAGVAAATVPAPVAAASAAPAAPLPVGGAQAAAVMPPPAAASPVPAPTLGPALVPTPGSVPKTVSSGETVFSAPPAAVESAASGLVQLRTSEASWIEVRDARGSTLLSRTVMPGESVGLDGKLPIRLTIGNASATQLGFRGQPVDLGTRTRDNVARVELQ